MSQNLGTASETQKAVTTANSTLFSASDTAHGRLVYVPTGLTVSIKFGANASTTDFSVAIAGPGYFAFPAPIYQGQVDCVASASGNVQVTQW